MSDFGEGVRVVAVDWSGAKSAVHKKIWLAEVVDGRMVRLETGRDREEVVEHLIGEAALGCPMVVGLDFAFAFPAWFTLVEIRGGGGFFAGGAMCCPPGSVA